MTLTAATVKRDYLHPALDARACNQQQDRLVYSGTPEPDSLLEFYQELLRRRPDLLDDPVLAGMAADALTCIRQLVASNQLEGDSENRIAGKADRLVTDLRRAELNGGGEPGMAAKQVVREARDPIDFFSQAQPRALEHAAALGRLVARVPSAQLLAPAVRHDLGRVRFELFRQYVDAVNDDGVRDGVPNPAGQRGSTPDDLAEV